MLEAVLATLEHVADTTSDGSARGKAVGLIASIKQFAFIVCLCSLCPVLTVLNQASECMQQVNIDFLQAQQVLSALKTEYRAMRTEENWNKSLTSLRILLKHLIFRVNYHCSLRETFLGDLTEIHNLSSPCTRIAQKI